MTFDLHIFGYVNSIVLLKTEMFLALQGTACGLLSNKQGAETNSDYCVQVLQIASDLVC